MWGGGTGLGAGVPLWASSTQRAGLQRWRCAALSSMQRLHLPCAEVPAGSEVRAPAYRPTVVLGHLGLSSLTPVLAPSLAFQDFQGGPCEPGRPCRQPWAWPGHVSLSPRSHCVHVREGCWQRAFLLHSWRPKYQTVGWVSPLGARPSRSPQPLLTPSRLTSVTGHRTSLTIQHPSVWGPLITSAKSPISKKDHVLRLKWVIAWWVGQLHCGYCALRQGGAGLGWTERVSSSWNSPFLLTSRRVSFGG